MRNVLGADTIPLVLHSTATSTERPYATLASVERHALMSRIWSGLHFRDAMDDAYQLGHLTANRVARDIR